MQENQRQQVLIAVHDEARRLFRRLGIDHAAKFHPLMPLVIDALGVYFLIGNNSHGKTANARITADHGLAIFPLVLVELARIHDAPNDFFDVIRTCCRRFVNSVDLFGGECWQHGLFAVPGRLTAVAPFFNDRSNSQQARLIVGLVEINGPADCRVHGGAAQFFGGDFLSDGSLHQRRAGKEEPTAVGH